MKKLSAYFSITITALSVVLILFTFSCMKQAENRTENLVGAWKGKVQFNTGVYAEIKDFEFMYVFNSGGTMTESSNYDGVPPTPPAYGIWKKAGEKEYETHYEFYWNNVPNTYVELVKAGGFTNAGYGVLSEKITLSDDGNSYTSTIKFTLFDKAGKQLVSNEEGAVEAKRMEF